MSSDIYSRITQAIENYEGKKYSEADFHLTIQSIIPFITEVDLDNFRMFLHDKEAELELIDFTVNKADQREKYLQVAKQIKEYLLQIT
jgi:hypothetical protein